MIVTRYLADCIYKRDVAPASGLLLGAWTILLLAGLCLSGWFYFFYAALPPALAISAVINFLLLSAMWLINVFISTLKNYSLITRAFLLGMTLAIFACVWLAPQYGTTGMVYGFSLGIALIIGMLCGSVLAYYPHLPHRPFAFLSYFRSHWEIALSGLIYNLAIWVDKWIMWFAPEAIRLDNGLIVYPHYDSAMFMAYLTTVPAMAMFLFNTETRFFDRYVRFYRDIEEKAPLAHIHRNHQAITESIVGSAGQFLLLQGSITLLGLIMAPEIITYLNGNYLQVGILRYGLLGALFNVLTLFLLILLSYFDSRKAVLFIQVFFLICNALFTWGSLHAGFQYYGYGYFLASFGTFIISVCVLFRHLANLPYHTFITTNSSIP